MKDFIWVYIQGDPQFHLQSNKTPMIEATICGIHNVKPLAFAVEAYDPTTENRCPDCIKWYERLTIQSMIEENQ